MAPAKRSAHRQTAFLSAFAACGSLTHAAKAAGVSRRIHYKWKCTDPDYAARYEEARIQACDSLEDEAVERATIGVFEPNVFEGRFVYPQEEVITPAVLGPRGGILEPERREWRDVPGAPPLGIWRKSDSLLIQLLRAAMPEKYGWRGAVELSGPKGEAMEIVERIHAGRRRVAALTIDPVIAPIPEIRTFDPPGV